jgi:uncharacterized membrane protein YkvA (DUF1232 family)
VDLSLILAVVLGIAALWAVALIAFWLVRPKGVPASELLRLLPDTVRLLRAVIADSKAPTDVRVVLVGLLVWLVSPIDLIPEFIPVIGPIDDVVVAIAALRYARRRMGLEGLRAHWAGTDAGFAVVARLLGGRVA